MSDVPIVCTLSPEALEARKRNLLNALASRALERQELPDGYRLRFSVEGGMLSLVAEAVEAERHCCRFLRFTVTVDPEGGGISLDLTGPPGAREFIAALLSF
jgi:hypothetical protein